MFSNGGSSSSLNTLAHLAEYRIQLSLPAYRYLSIHEDTLNRDTRIEIRCQNSSLWVSGKLLQPSSLYSSTRTRVELLCSHQFASATLTRDHTSKSPPPIPPPSLPSRSKLTRRARQALHRQTDASFRLHIGPPPPSSSALSVFFSLHSHTTFNYLHSAEETFIRPSLRTTLLARGLLVIREPLLESVTFIHSFNFFGSILPRYFCARDLEKGRKGKGILSWKSLDHTVHFNLQTHTFAFTQLDNMSQSSRPSWKLVLAALLASFSLATAHFEFQYPPWRGNTLKDDMQWKYPCTVANSLLFQRTWG